MWKQSSNGTNILLHGEPQTPKWSNNKQNYSVEGASGKILNAGLLLIMEYFYMLVLEPLLVWRILVLVPPLALLIILRGISMYAGLPIPTWTFWTDKITVRPFMPWPAMHKYRQSPPRHKLVPFKQRFIVSWLTNKELNWNALPYSYPWLNVKWKLKPFFCALLVKSLYPLNAPNCLPANMRWKPTIN